LAKGETASSRIGRKGSRCRNKIDALSYS
jgi:hypothetical protein